MKTLVLLVCTLLSSSAALAQENIVLNGGFERLFAGWQGTYGQIDNATFALEGSAVGVVTDLGSSSIGQALHQTLNTEPNQQYRLRFSLLSGAGRAGEQSPPGASPVRVTWGDNVLGSFSNGSISDWKSYEFSVRATGGATRLGFESLGTRFQLIDGISVVAIPEPPTVALAAAGLTTFLIEGFRRGNR